MTIFFKLREIWKNRFLASKSLMIWLNVEITPVLENGKLSDLFSLSVAFKCWNIKYNRYKSFDKSETSWILTKIISTNKNQLRTFHRHNIPIYSLISESLMIETMMINSLDSRSENGDKREAEYVEKTIHNFD